MQKINTGLLSIFFLLFFLNSQEVVSQKFSNSQIKEMVNRYKQDPKGPYSRIKWFCDDGSIRDPKDYCPNGGIQHATYKPEVEKLAKENHIYFGNILAYNKYDTFWDEPNNHSRLKQYQLVKYLTGVDNGWIYRKGQFYRGAMQTEDEENWGKEFYLNLLKDPSVLEKNFYLVRQSLKDIPHMGDTNLAQKMRSQSKVIAEELPGFMKTRIKIHGNPDKSDIQAVKDWKAQNKSKLSQEQSKKIDELIKTLEAFYAPVQLETLVAEVTKLKGKKSSKETLTDLLNNYGIQKTARGKVYNLSDLMCNIREEMDNFSDPADKLALLDLSNKLENILFVQSQEWKPANVKELLEKIQALSNAAVGTGLIELWEWEEIDDVIENTEFHKSMALKDMNQYLVTSRGVVEWSTAMVKAVYENEVELYAAFEPKAYQFIDDRIRSSVILDLGDAVSKLGNIITKHASIKNDVLGISDASTVHGLNPGYAYGELVVVEGVGKQIDFNKDKIYAFEHPSADLKPVAGILSVSEGNLVSHVQLLARNLGIPNAALSNQNIKELKKYNGKKVFYAVSPKGNVILKLEKDMTSKEKALFSEKKKSSNKVKVPVDRIKLDQTDLIDIRKVKADDSGKICGPKAANLGQLKQLFPDHVVEGFVIPFGIFRKHLDNTMPGQNTTYWKYLNETYANAEKMRKEGKSLKEIDAYQINRLSTLKKAIETMPLNKDFVAQLEQFFKNTFKKPLGSQAVFLRSDTNMEDLKEFTGAGLNLTLFNIKDKNAILKGIKEVWASPYTERSLRWRQKYLLNPEYVFPSIVVIPGVNNDYSGVVITTGINEGGKDDITAAFSRGVGGAVEGQSAETRLITKNSDKLLAPAREPSYMVLPASGDVQIRYATFEKPILNKKNIQSIRDIVKEVRVKMPKNTDPDYKGAYDMEMGFQNDKLWLFQIRPFVQNKNASTSEYLNSITPKIDYSKKISLEDKI